MTASASPCTLFLCGDVMTGRGVDQILPHPGAPHLYEPYVSSAREYVDIAEQAHGTIPQPVDWTYPWGVAIDELQRRQPSARVINLETSVTTSEDAEPKGINYRMHPANVPVLTAAGIDCAVLANNHVLDWGDAGLVETLRTLADAHIQVAGAGLTLAEALAPAVLNVHDARVLVFAMGAFDSGVPREWRAENAKSGVHWIGDYSASTVDGVAALVASVKRPRDVAVASLHWGSNWGHDIPVAHRSFAHALIEDAGIDLVYGHSSHHPRAIEVHRGRAILYGCGDFLNDYEGIVGQEGHRSDLALMYFPTIDIPSGTLAALEMVPLLIRNFRLRRASAEDAQSLREMLDRECRRFGSALVGGGDHLRLVWT